MKTGEFLATLRRASGLTQKDVAEKLGVSDRTLSSWETDRTCPDLLLLPAIADIYGVTADEILRGERAPQKDGELSEKALRSAKKRRYGKFTAKCVLLSFISVTGGCLLILAGMLFLFVSSPLWLDILLAVLGFCDIAVCFAIVCYSEYTARISEGIVLSEDLDESSKKYCLAVKKKTALFLTITASPFLLAGAILFIIFATGIIYDREIDTGIAIINIYIVEPYLIISSVLLAFGGAILLAAIIYGAVNLKKYGSDGQLKVTRSNGKFILKLAGFGAIPIAAFLILYIIFSYVSPCIKYEPVVQYDSANEFLAAAQTMTLTEDDPLHTECGVAAGEYHPSFPQEYDRYHLYPLGDGFYGHWSDRYDGTWRIYYLKADAPPEVNEYGYIDNENEYFYPYYFEARYESIWTGDGFARFINIEFFNLREKNNDIDYGFGIASYRGSVYAYQSDGEFKGKCGFYEYEYLYLWDFFKYLTLIAAGAALCVTSTLYIVKHKKQDFSF